MAEDTLAGQKSLATNILNFSVNTKQKKAAKVQTLKYFEARLKLLEDYWEKFVSRDARLAVVADKFRQDEYFASNYYSLTEDAYLDAKAEISEDIENLKGAPSGPSADEPISPKPNIIERSTPPTLTVPTFDGTQEDWESFKERFSAFIESRPGLSNISKLQHLLEAMRGPAAQRLKGIRLVGSNFKVAWDRLLRRFDNRHRRLSSHLESLIELPHIRPHNLRDLTDLIDKAEIIVEALADLDYPLDQCNHFVVHCIVRRLDVDTRESWNLSRMAKETFPSYAELTEFLEHRIQSLEPTSTSSIKDSVSKSTSRETHSKQKPQRPIFANTVQTESSSRNSNSFCPLCRNSHSIFHCAEFRDKSTSERFAFSKREGLCLNCLGRNHRLGSCPSSKRCSSCKGKHHTLLHFERPNKTEPWQGAARDRSHSQQIESPSDSSSQVVQASTTIMASAASRSKSVLLATAKIIVASHSGSSLVVRALVDPAAERSFVSSRVASYLSLNRTKVSVSIIGVGASRCAQALGDVSVLIKSKLDPGFQLSLTALVIDEVTRFLPSSNLVETNWHHVQQLSLADPDFATPSRIDAILGADVYPDILQEGVIHGPPGTPIAQSTVFGWILSGAIDSSNPRKQTLEVFHTRVEESVSTVLQKFWEIEEIPTKSIWSVDDQFCEDLFTRTTSRNKQGRFVVRLPFCKRTPLIDSKQIAQACLARSVRRRSKVPSLDEAYKAFMHEYQQLGHMKPSSSSERENAKCYLPHHAVFRKDNSSKIRVVFNASQKGRNGLSLNDLLLPGPKLQSDIGIVLTNWRFHSFVFTADIVKMFRQILVHADDAQWQHILWQDSAESPMLDLQAVTVTYGTAPAPFLAIRTLLQLALEGSSCYSQAAEILKSQIYVDDIFSGASSIELAMSRRKELTELLATAGMELSKWAANEPQLVGDISTSGNDVHVDLDASVSALGLLWRPSVDSFFFSLNLPPPPSTPTKRMVLSETAKLFDPLGWLAPVIVIPKLIMQDIWLSQVDWDTPLSDEILSRWKTFRDSLSFLSRLQVRRFTGINESEPWSLHGFCDASKRAYGAVLYARSRSGEITLLLAKSKVAPLKVQSLPRLELCGALLVTRLARHLVDNVRVRPISINFWTDSQVVLDWLKGHPSKWNVFVANRVSEIQSAFASASWKHVVSADNPADAASRGVYPEQLASLKIWWNGPNWLRQFANCPLATEQVVPESSTHALAALEVKNSPNNSSHGEQEHILTILSRCSNFNKILRILGLCRRWRLKAPRGMLSGAEWSAARRSLFLLVQQQNFKLELSHLRRGTSLTKSSPLVRLSPFIDEDGLLRVGGRLQNASLSYGEKHPVILPRHDRFVRLLVEDAHKVTLHGGPQVMSSFLHRSCWIIGGSRLVQSVYRRCVVCARFTGRSVRQQMAPLPACRLTALRPFAYTGIDFAGPFPIRMSKGRGAKATKGYLAVFVCMAVRAVHLEVVSDLTTEAFLAAFSRFTSRRGVCVKVYSDNGTTFKGAAAELSNIFDAASPDLQRMAGQLASQGTSWEFIPPRAPHFGGLWEAAVKSFKFHYRRVLGESKLTFEEMSTLATRIEACLNSRPLSPLSSSGTDAVALTPGHFLVGSTLLSLPEPPQEVDLTLTTSNRWSLISQMRISFWNRWKKEVLHQLQLRNQWTVPCPNLKVDDVVVMKDELTPPAHWPLARVTQVHPGADNLVRVVTVKTAHSEFTRPVTKLVRLPVDELVEQRALAAQATT